MLSVLDAKARNQNSRKSICAILSTYGTTKTVSHNHLIHVKFEAMANLSRQQRQASDLWQTAEKLLSEGNPKRAKPVLYKLVKMLPDEPAPLYNLGACCFELEQFDQAIKYLKSALNNDPGIVEANVVLGRALKVLEKYWRQLIVFIDI